MEWPGTQRQRSRPWRPATTGVHHGHALLEHGRLSAGSRWSRCTCVSLEELRNSGRRVKRSVPWQAGEGYARPRMPDPRDDDRPHFRAMATAPAAVGHAPVDPLAPIWIAAVQVSPAADHVVQWRKATSPLNRNDRVVGAVNCEHRHGSLGLARDRMDAARLVGHVARHRRNGCQFPRHLARQAIRHHSAPGQASHVQRAGSTLSVAFSRSISAAMNLTSSTPGCEQQPYASQPSAIPFGYETIHPSRSVG
jgi:hypothetical protein